MWKRTLGSLYPFILISLTLLAFLTIARITHAWLFSDHLDSFYQLGPILFNGLRIDLMAMAYVFGIPIILYMVLHTFIKRLSRPFKYFFISWAVAISLAIIFMEIITPFYMLEYGVRPERKFFEYLSSPKEVILMLWGMYGIASIIILAVLLGIAPLLYRIVTSSYLNIGTWPVKKFLWVFPITLLAIFICARSSFDHRPINPSMVAVTDDALVNTLPLNSLYSVLYAVYQLKHEANASEIYGNLSNAEILKYVKSNQKQNTTNTFQLISSGVATNRPKNLVIILEESLGARYVERLGGQALTPHLNSFAEQGWWFNNLYATGTRSVRGLEAVISGFLPTPGRSVVKLSKSQSNFFTLASLLG